MFSKNKLFVLLFTSFLAVFASCGNDNSATKPSSLPSEVADMAELEEYKCGMSLIGEIVYVKDKRKNYECDGDHWFESYNQSKLSSCKKQGDGGSRSTSSGQAESAMTSNCSVLSSDSVYGCKTELEDFCEYGELVDSRDGQIYKTVKIGDQWWMAENLNYAYIGVPYKVNSINDSNYSDSTSWCYNNDVDNCTKYGRLYTWAAAMDSAGLWSLDGWGCGRGSSCSPTGAIRGICPEGWRLPTKTEWYTLFTAVGGDSISGAKLKSTSGWTSSGNGVDAFSFSGLPVGRREFLGDFKLEGDYAYFWSSTESNSIYTFSMYLHYDHDYAGIYLIGKSYGFSVRCLKD